VIFRVAGGELLMAVSRHPPYCIATDRLRVRCWDPTDASRLLEALGESRTDLLPWLPWAVDEPTTLDRKVELLRTFRGRFDLGEEFVYGVFDPDETRVIGGTGFHMRVGPNAFEIGYWIRSSETRHGLATEVAGALTKVAFVLMEVDRVEIRVEPTNRASLAIPKKLGFEREALLKRRHPSVGGTMKDLVVWSMFARTYPRSPAAKLRVRAWDAAGRELPGLGATPRATRTAATRRR
jgi:RimJ/RimL family protein N-acetyltransferase